MVGRIEDVGAELRHVYSPGQRVAYWGQTDFDGLAEWRILSPVSASDRGRDSWFTDRGFHDDHGAAVAVIPEGLSSANMSLAEPLTSVMRAIYWNPPSPGDRCLILGAGPSGLLALQVLGSLFPTSMVEIVDRNDFRLQVGRDLGATVAINIDTEGELLTNRGLTAHGDALDYVFDALPHVEASVPRSVRSMAKALLRPGGKYVVYGATTMPQSMDTWSILAKGLTVSSAPFDVRLFPMSKSASVLAHSVHLLGTGVIDAEPLVTHQIPFADEDGVRAAFAHYGDHEDLKTVITFEDSGARRL